MKISTSDIKVYVKLIHNKSVFAQANIVLLDVLEIHGFTVSKSQHIHPKFQEEIWIQPPKIRIFSFWKAIVFINDKELWEYIEEEIYNKYIVAKNKNTIEAINEDVDPKDIPF